MNYALTSAQMKACDRHTIEDFGVSSLVLQQDAAGAVFSEVIRYLEQHMSDIPYGRLRVRVYAGSGNNGADAVALACKLEHAGIHTKTYLIGAEAKRTEEMRTQCGILQRYGFECVPYRRERPANIGTCDLVIDGILGVGCDRTLEGTYRAAVQEINGLKARGAAVISVDIASGVNADDGRIMGCAVSADATAVLAFYKTGHLLYPGAACQGKCTLYNIGITERSLLTGRKGAVVPDACYYPDLSALPLKKRKASGNKGTFGKVLLITGSAEISGAAILSTEAALRSGCGMARLFTSALHRDAVTCALPETLLDTYAPDDSDETVMKKLDKALSWADAVVIGCGLGTDETAHLLLSHTLQHAKCPMVIDADGLNLLAADAGLRRQAARYQKRTRHLVLTPHMAEFARLYGKGTADCAAHITSYPRLLAGRYHACILCKDARSVVADEEHAQYYINLSGNDGMATAGSGDVLAGLTGTLLAQGYTGYDAACMASYLHGLAGDAARDEKGASAMIAGDIVRHLGDTIRRAHACAEGK